MLPKYSLEILDLCLLSKSLSDDSIYEFNKELNACQNYNDKF